MGLREGEKVEEKSFDSTLPLKRKKAWLPDELALAWDNPFLILAGHENICKGIYFAPPSNLWSEEYLSVQFLLKFLLYRKEMLSRLNRISLKTVEWLADCL